MKAELSVYVQDIFSATLINLGTQTRYTVVSFGHN